MEKRNEVAEKTGRAYRGQPKKKQEEVWCGSLNKLKADVALI